MKKTRKPQTIISRGFAQLRKDGYLAKQSFWCCNSCAWAAMTYVQAEKAVFYHSQEASSLKKTGDVWLAWSGDGQHIIDTFLKLGMNPLDIEWDGSLDSKILLRNTWVY